MPAAAIISPSFSSPAFSCLSAWSIIFTSSYSASAFRRQHQAVLDIDRRLQGICRANALSLTLPPCRVFGVDAHAPWTGAGKLSTLCCRCYEPTAHCNKSREPVGLSEMFRRRRYLHPALRRPEYYIKYYINIMLINRR